jgi:hypothetical protein
MISGVLRVLFYLSLGPLIGMLVGNIAIGLHTYAMTGNTIDFVFDGSLFAPANLIASYTLGLLPALLTAIIAIVLRRPLSGWRYWLWIGLAGAILSLILAWTVVGMSPIGQGLEPIFFVVIASAGAAAGFACTALFDALGSLFARGR